MLTAGVEKSETAGVIGYPVNLHLYLSSMRATNFFMIVFSSIWYFFGGAYAKILNYSFDMDSLVYDR